MVDVSTGLPWKSSAKRRPGDGAPIASSTLQFFERMRYSSKLVQALAGRDSHFMRQYEPSRRLARLPGKKKAPTCCWPFGPRGLGNPSQWSCLETIGAGAVPQTWKGSAMAKYTIESRYCSTLGMDVHARTPTRSARTAAVRTSKVALYAPGSHVAFFERAGSHDGLLRWSLYPRGHELMELSSDSDDSCFLATFNFSHFIQLQFHSVIR